MGFLNELRKLFFAKKAVAKSAAEKAVEKGRETGEALKEKAAEGLHLAEEKAKATGDQLAENAGDIVEEARRKLQEFEERIFGPTSLEKETPPKEPVSERPAADKAPQTSPEGDEKVDFGAYFGEGEKEPGKLDELKDAARAAGEKLMETTEPVVEKAKELAESVGEQVLDTGEKVMDKLGKIAEDVGETTLEKGGQVVEKAKKAAEELGEKILKAKDELVEKAEKEAAQSPDDTLLERLKKTVEGDKPEDFDTRPPDWEKSNLDQHQSFWEKAERFAEGDYSAAREQPPAEGELSIRPAQEEAPKKKTGKVKGFEDLDGDGDEIVDDAILEEE